MLIKKYKCDRCGILMDESYYIFIGKQDIDGNSLDIEDDICDKIGDKLGDVHICKSCALGFIDNFKIEEDCECGLPFAEVPEEVLEEAAEDIAPEKASSNALSKEELEILINSKPLEDIAKQCECTTRTIRNWCEKYGIKIPRHYKKRGSKAKA